ncbi:methyltransferase domain-containing protein [Thermococcus sp.]|uniref:class I SAM-dependent methyltransferase n=1 Tax=Thermococcus sp. TaxID=35749 RepID=UPI002612B613|nr:methyltransferase domain-containing protein [Thermococcus sp.]
MGSPIKLLDRNFEAMTKMALSYLVQIGLKYDVFRKLEGGARREEILERIPVSNRAYLDRLIDSYLSLGILEAEDGLLRVGDFSYDFSLTGETVRKLLPDWIRILEEMYRMADYAFISPEHPKILMDFDKGADFWDMRLLMALNRAYRKLIIELAGIEDGSRVLDLGCGSVSPVEIGESVGPNGRYVGVDFSPGLLSIAKTRVRNLGMDWVILRELDVRRIVPRNTYDVVVMAFLLEYLPEREDVVNLALSMLNPGGRIVIIDPFRDRYELLPALEFFESLTPEFVSFPSIEGIVDAVERGPHDVRVEVHGGSAILITKHS